MSIADVKSKLYTRVTFRWGRRVDPHACFCPERAVVEVVDDMEISAFPECQKCKQGDLVPLSDFGSQGAAIQYKAWACTNPTCGFNIKIRNGDLYIDEPIASGALHSPRPR